MEALFRRLFSLPSPSLRPPLCISICLSLYLLSLASSTFAATPSLADPICAPIGECDPCVRKQILGDNYCQWCSANDHCFDITVESPLFPSTCDNQADIVSLAYASKCQRFLGLPLAGGIILLIFIILCPILVLVGFIFWCRSRKREQREGTGTAYRAASGDFRSGPSRTRGTDRGYGYTGTPRSLTDRSQRRERGDGLQKPLMDENLVSLEASESVDPSDASTPTPAYHPPIASLTTKASQLPLFPLATLEPVGTVPGVEPDPSVLPTVASAAPPNDALQVELVGQPAATGTGFYLPVQPETDRND